uniref:Sulfate transport system permease protein CysT n=1 Tax=Takakia lepidozioides TaxID=37425 RepID=A0A0S3QP88_TAKLE|nr:sulfate transport ATP-binding protein [Takakia lepidozioides]UPM51681.1 sulfate transport ATP-binding protein [Takakia lepidozioides]
MIQLLLIPPLILFSITKGEIRFINKFELTLALALHYGIYVLALPISLLLYRTKEQSWNILWRVATEPVVLSAYSITFSTAFLAAIANASFGSILAWILVKYEFPGKKALDAAVDLPFALPTSVGGLTLMTVYSDRGWMGPICSWLGIRIVFSRLGVSMAMIFVSLPFVVRTIQPVSQNTEEELEEAAWCVGASPWTTFRHILFPPLTPSLLTGTALGFSRAIGEYGSIVLIASNIPMKDLVISVLIFQRLEQYDYPGATVVATLVLIASFGVLLTINQIQIWRQTLNG